MVFVDSVAGREIAYGRFHLVTHSKACPTPRPLTPGQYLIELAILVLVHSRDVVKI